MSDFNTATPLLHRWLQVFIGSSVNSYHFALALDESLCYRFGFDYIYSQNLSQSYSARFSSPVWRDFGNNWNWWRWFWSTSNPSFIYEALQLTSGTQICRCTTEWRYNEVNTHRKAVSLAFLGKHLQRIILSHWSLHIMTYQHRKVGKRDKTKPWPKSLTWC